MFPGGTGGLDGTGGLEERYNCSAREVVIFAAATGLLAIREARKSLWNTSRNSSAAFSRALGPSICWLTTAFISAFCVYRSTVFVRHSTDIAVSSRYPGRFSARGPEGPEGSVGPPLADARGKYSEVIISLASTRNCPLKLLIVYRE